MMTPPRVPSESLPSRKRQRPDRVLPSALVPDGGPERRSLSRDGRGPGGPGRKGWACTGSGRSHSLLRACDRDSRSYGPVTESADACLSSGCSARSVGVRTPPGPVARLADPPVFFLGGGPTKWPRGKAPGGGGVVAGDARRNGNRF